MKKIIKPRSLYLVLSSEYIPKDREYLDVISQAIDGGVDIIQVREKTMPRTELARLCGSVRTLCGKRGVIFIINDDPVLAVECGADGVHMGQGDISKVPLKKVREIVGADKIIGISTHSPGEYREALDSGADYLAYGPIFPTKTKSYNIGINDVKEVVKVSKKPTVFIGGIDLENVDELISRGADIVAAIRSIVTSEDITRTVKQFKERLGRSSCRDTDSVISVNGKREFFESGITIGRLVESRNLFSGKIVVEHNGNIIHNSEWDKTIINAGDTLEIVSFVGGG